MTTYLAIFAVLLFGLAGLGFYLEKDRQKRIIETYGESDMGRAIANRKIFLGMSSWQLLEVWGQPDVKESSVSKTKMKETWLYGKAGRGYSNRVYLEDGYVVGWKQRRS